jgi:hypothetical protein
MFMDPAKCKMLVNCCRKLQKNANRQSTENKLKLLSDHSRKPAFKLPFSLTLVPGRKPDQIENIGRWFDKKISENTSPKSPSLYCMLTTMIPLLASGMISEPIVAGAPPPT